VDGSAGGGQILRSALSLSVLTGRPFVIEQIRKQRKRAGLMRQHLTAVNAAAAICGARTQGAELLSTRLEFQPGALCPGAHRFAIGSAGSTCLVLQTVLPPLMLAGAGSLLTFEGGTHNPMAPSYAFLARVFFPLIMRMGVRLTHTLARAGFYPAGGGAITLQIEPTRALAPLTLHQRGALRRVYAEAVIANIPHQVARRELAVVQRRLALPEAALMLRTPEADGPGNVLLIGAEHEHVAELVSAYGERGVRAEQVAERACDEMTAYLASPAPVGEHLSDQLLIPLALAGAGSFHTRALTDHARTNMRVIEQFLPVRFAVSELAGGDVCIGLQA
jgi:RNA 3'-terminal phosphate cyclase (ATP)